jgi:hypothetical protein
MPPKSGSLTPAAVETRNGRPSFLKFNMTTSHGVKSTAQA